MDKKIERKGLGRGLSALMADVNVDAPQAMSGTGRQTDLLVPIEMLVPNPTQPRRSFPAGALEELAASIRQRGIIQPIIVRRVAGGRQFEIVAGERRWRAAQIAQLHQVPVIERDFSDLEVLEVAIIENVQRADLNAIEEAQAYRQLMERFGHTQEKIAEALSRSRSHIANQLRLLALPDDVQSMVKAGTLSPGHARALITSPDSLALAQKVVGQGLSVRQTEDLVRKSAVVGRRGKAGNLAKKDADTRALEADLSANLNMSVRIDHNPGVDGGRVTISYKTLDELDLLCRALSAIPRDMETR